VQRAAEAERVRLAEMQRIARRNARIEAEAISINAANEAANIQREIEAKVRLAQELATNEAEKAAAAIALKQAETEERIRAISIKIQEQRRKDLIAMRGVDVGQAEKRAIEARSRAIAAAEAANASAKKVFDEVVTSAKYKLSVLQAKADSIQNDYKIKV